MKTQNTGKEPAEMVRILVAEDSPVNRALAVKQLEKLGYGCDAVSDGTEVMKAVRKEPYGIILMDCLMPEMSGYEATWQIREAERKKAVESADSERAYIIAMTANSEADTRERCREAGMDDFIDKPVQLAELEAALRRALADRGAQSALDAVIDPIVIAGLRQLRTPGAADPVAELIDLFLKEAPSQLDVMENSVFSTDPGALSNAIGAATALKGGAANMGAKNVAALADEFLQASKTGYLSLSKPLVQKARAELERAKRALERIKAEA